MDFRGLIFFRKNSMSWRYFFPLFWGLLFWSSYSFAFQYEIVADKLFQASPLHNHEFSSWFGKKGYRGLSSLGVLSAKLPLDFVFISPRFEKAILLKAGLKAPLNEQGKIIQEQASGLSVFHFQIESTPYVLVALNIPRGELQELLRPWMSGTGAAAKWQLLLPQRAEASESCASAGANKWTVNINEAAVHIEQTEMLQSIGRCGVQALQGLSSSMEDSLSFFRKLAIDPSSLWNEMKDSFVELKNFALNFQQEIGPILNALRGLSSEEKMQIACSMSGQIVASAAQTLVSGAALAKALPAMLLKLKKVSQLLLKVAQMEKRGLGSTQNKNLIETVIRCEL